MLVKQAPIDPRFLQTGETGCRKSCLVMKFYLSTRDITTFDGKKNRVVASNGFLGDEPKYKGILTAVLEVLKFKISPRNL